LCTFYFPANFTLLKQVIKYPLHGTCMLAKQCATCADHDQKDLIYCRQ